MIIGSSSKTIHKNREEVGTTQHSSQIWWSPTGDPADYEDWGTTNQTVPNRVQRRESIAYDRGDEVYFKNCVHVKDALYTTGTDSVQSKHYWDSNGFLLTIVNTPAAELVRALGTNSAILTLPGSTPIDERIDGLLTKDQLNDLLAIGFRTMVPRVDQLTENFNLLSFLYELKDLKSMFKVWSRNTSFMKNASSAVLNWNLGWKPMIADCQRIWNKVVTLNQKIKQWNKDAEKGVIYTRHADLTKDLIRLTSLPPGGESWSNRNVITSHDDLYDQYNNNLGVGRRYYDEATSRTCKFVTHLMFRPKPLDLRFIEDYVSLWYDALSFGETGSIVWNAIPFSFVVDYFWSIGDFLEQIEVETVDMGYDLVDFGYSLKVEDRTHRTYWFGDDADVIKWSLGTRCLVSKTYVRRRAHIPSSVSDPDWSLLWDLHLPSWHQAWIGVNLLNVLR